jgi:hypothetical protein
VTTVLVGTEDGLVELDGTQTVHLAGHAVPHVAVAGESWWAISDTKQVRRRDGQGAWAPAVDVASGALKCLLPEAGGLLMGMAEASLLRLTSEGVAAVDSFQAVPGRDGWYTPWGGPPDTRSLASAEGVLYVNVHVGGIPRSRDGGSSWTPTIDVDTDVHQVLAVDGRVLAACGDEGLAVSHDGGESWTVDTDGLHATYCRAVAVAGDTVLVSASEGPRGARSAVYRRPLDGSRSFERCREGLPEWFDGNIDTFCLAAHGSECAFGTRDGRVFRSDDAGAHWGQAADGLATVRSVVLTSG